jgi:RNA polymerase sigma-70 factor, ECF subfamily
VQADVDDTYLVTRAQEGYLDAFEMLVARYSPIAYRVALRLLGDHHDAQDVAQESLLAAWQNLPHFRRDSSFATWLYQVVTRRALNRLTRGHRGETVEVPETLPAKADGPAESASRNQSAAAVTAAVAALPAAQRVAVVLHHFEGLSYSEVATITDSSVPAVRSHLFRARRTLATTLGQWR